MGLQNLCTLFGPTLMKLSPKDNREVQLEDMNKEIKESMQQAQVLFYLLQLHAEDRLIADPEAADKNDSSPTAIETKKSDNDFNENMTKLNLKSNTSNTLPEESFKDSNPHVTSSYLHTDKNNNNLNKNFVNMKANSPENNLAQQNSAPKTPSRQPPNPGEKYAKLNMQTAL